MTFVASALLLAAAAAAPGAAPDWWLVGANARSAMFADRASLKRRGHQVVQQVTAVMPNAPIRRIEVVERLDCQARTATDLKIVYQLSNGQSINRTPEPKPRQLTPRTVGWATFQFACGSEATRAALATPIGSTGLEEMAQLAVASAAKHNEREAGYQVPL